MKKLMVFILLFLLFVREGELSPAQEMFSKHLSFSLFQDKVFNENTTLVYPLSSVNIGTASFEKVQNPFLNTAPLFFKQELHQKIRQDLSSTDNAPSLMNIPNSLDEEKKATFDSLSQESLMNKNRIPHSHDQECNGKELCRDGCKNNCVHSCKHSKSCSKNCSGNFSCYNKEHSTCGKGYDHREEQCVVSNEHDACCFCNLCQCNCCCEDQELLAGGYIGGFGGGNFGDGFSGGSGGSGGSGNGSNDDNLENLPVSSPEPSYFLLIAALLAGVAKKSYQSQQEAS